MVTTSRFFKAIIIVVSMYMLEFFDIVLPSGNTDMIRVIIGSVGAVLAVVTLCLPNKSAELKRRLKFANKFFIIYIPIVILTAVFSVIWYRYKFASTLQIVVPYIIPLYAYPLIYIFYRDKTYEKFMKKIVALVVIILCIKALTWYLYNYMGIALFPKLLFKYSEAWVRNGVLRMDVGYLYGVALSYVLCMFFVQHKRKAAIIAVGMAMFVLFITQYRYLEIVIIITVLLVYLTSTNSNKKELIRILILAFACIMFIALGGLDAIFASFSVENKEYGSSNEARILTIEYFWSLLDGIEYVVGLGFVYAYSPAALAILVRSNSLSYWMEDIGIVGGFFTFGLLSFAIYVPLFVRSVKSCLFFIRNKLADRAYLTSLVGYMIACCIMLNIFDRQRIYDTAFYVALISFISAQADLRINSPLLNHKQKGSSP